MDTLFFLVPNIHYVLLLVILVLVINQRMLIDSRHPKPGRLLAAARLVSGVLLIMLLALSVMVLLAGMIWMSSI